MYKNFIKKKLLMKKYKINQMYKNFYKWLILLA